MELKRLSAKDMEQVRKVWKTCFGDSDDFLDAYFAACVSIQDGLGFFENGVLLSDMFTYRVNANISGMIYQSQFIAGCATLPEARNQHLMRALIKAALIDMADRGVCVCFLHPFLHSFYRKFGFETVAYVDRATTSAQAGKLPVRIVSSFSDLPFDSIFASYSAYVTQFGNYFMRSKARMEAWLKLLFADGGRAAYIDGVDSTPYALFYEIDTSQGKESDIFELVFFTEDQRDALTRGTGLRSSYFLPASARKTDGNEASEFTMMRVLDPRMMLKTYQYTPGTPAFVINIHDAFLNRDYNLQVEPGKNTTVTPVEATSNIVTDAAGLAQLFTGVYDPREYPAASTIFAQGSSCYFETY